MTELTLDNALQLQECWIFEARRRLQFKYGDIHEFSFVSKVEYDDAYLFFEGCLVRQDAFKAICEILDFDWEEVKDNRELEEGWIYLAGPLFTQAETAFNRGLADKLRTSGYPVYLPQEECSGITDAAKLFGICIRGLDGASMVLVILDGADADSGSCFEVGYAFAKGIPVVGLRTDFRGSGDHMGVNLMLSNSCTHLLLTTLTPATPTPNVTYLNPGEDFTATLLEVLSGLPADKCDRV